MIGSSTFYTAVQVAVWGQLTGACWATVWDEAADIIVEELFRVCGSRCTTSALCVGVEVVVSDAVESWRRWKKWKLAVARLPLLSFRRYVSIPRAPWGK